MFSTKSSGSSPRRRGLQLLLGAQSFIILAVSYYTVTNVSILYDHTDVLNDGFNDTVIAAAASSSCRPS